MIPHLDRKHGAAEGAIAADSAAVSPTVSARSDSSRVPQWFATPVPPAVIFNRVRRRLRFTMKVPFRVGVLGPSTDQVSQTGKAFSRTRTPHTPATTGQPGLVAAAHIRAQLASKLPTAATASLSFDEPWDDLGAGMAQLDDLFMPHAPRS